MSTENLVLLGALCVTTALNLMNALLFRSLAHGLVRSVMSYRPDPNTSEPTESIEPEEGRSPLQDVFQQYSKLTGRMADIIFQLTESRQGERDMVLRAARSIQEEASLAAAQVGRQVAADRGGQEPGAGATTSPAEKP